MQKENEHDKAQVCSRSVISCILATFLTSLLVVLIFELISPPYEEKIHIYEAQPIEMKANQMNPWNFEFLIDPADLCLTLNPPNSEAYQMLPEVKLLILVHSAVDHFDQRAAIRRTWGSVAERPFGPLRLGFVVGTSTNKTTSDLINKESLEYKDIIQVDYVDSFLQTTTKSILMLKWVAKRCPHAQFFLKAQVDAFVNIETVAGILNTEPFLSQDKFIGGYVKYENSLLPSLPEEEPFADMDSFPLPQEYQPYASGSAYVMSIPTAIELFDASKEVQPFLPDDDAFLTGLCAQHIAAQLIHEPSFTIDDPPTPPSWDAYSTLASVHSLTPTELEKVWLDMTQTIADVMANIESAINLAANGRAKRFAPGPPFAV